MNLKKIFYLYTCLFLYLVIHNTTISSSKHEKVIEDETGSAPKILSPIPLKRILPAIQESEEKNCHTCENFWLQLERHYPIAYYLLQAAAIYPASFGYEAAAAPAEKSDEDAQAKLYISPKNNIKFLEEIWNEFLALQTLPKTLVTKNFRDLYTSIPALTPSLSYLQKDKNALSELQAHPYCYYLMQAGVYVAIERDRRITSVTLFRDNNGLLLAEGDKAFIEEGDRRMKKVSLYWHLSGKIWEEMARLARKRKIDLNLYSQAYLSLVENYKSVNR